MTERDALLRYIQVCDFAINDAALFLDTHPDDRDALEFYKKHTEMRKKAGAEFAAKYGALSHMEHAHGANWGWGGGPWPWQTPTSGMKTPR